MHNIIPSMALIKEVSFIFDVHIPKPEVFCKFFEDHQICISMAESNKLSPKTKHIAIKYHNLQNFVLKKVIQICYIETIEQTADSFNNPLSEALFIYSKGKLYG